MFRVRVRHTRPQDEMNVTIVLSFDLHDVSLDARRSLLRPVILAAFLEKRVDGDGGVDVRGGRSRGSILQRESVLFFAAILFFPECTDRERDTK